MKNWIGCLNSSTPFLSCFLLFLLLFPLRAQAQSLNTLVAYQDLQPKSYPNALYFIRDDTATTDQFPDPNSVMYKSMIIPGWGQIVNRQIWKVPIIYGLLGGLTWYSIQLTKKYHDYRAAYYNLHPEIPDDFRFGPTPDYIPENSSLQQLRNIRNTYRNDRDLVYIGIVLAYGLNILDAYVFAHMRSFDVSEDLSMKAGIQPGVRGWAAVPGVTLSINLVTK